jgi:hypothetical protein
MRLMRVRVAAVAVAAVAAGLAGCSGDDVSGEVAAQNKSNIQRLANLYSAHQVYKGGRGPKTEAEFRQFIQAFEADKLQMMGVDTGNLDALFRSERDGKPFRIRYDVGGGRGSVDPVVFEQDGQGGTKQVAFTGGKVEDLDDTAYNQLWAAKAPGRQKAAPTKGGGRPTGPPAGAPTGPSG